MIISVDSRIFEKFPGAVVGVIVAKGINNHSVSDEASALLRQEENRVRQNFAMETFAAEPRITAWREAYRAFGAKPKEHRSSIENLCRVVLGGANLRHVNTLVDLYNVISLKYLLPVGGEDLDAVRGTIKLTFAGSNEPPALLLGDKEPHAPHPGEVIYRDDVSAICRRWNWREADRTKLTEDTKNCILVIEALPPVTRETIHAAADELAELVQKYCGGTAEAKVLDANNSTV